MNFGRATNFEFRYRLWIIGLAFWMLFSLYRVDRQNFVVAITGSHSRQVIQLMFGLAALIVLLSAILRSWASAYLRSEVVYDLKLRTDFLVADGPYRHTRNPLYFGAMLMAIGFGMLASRIGFPLLILFMFTFGFRLIAREEAELLRTHGDQFRAYCAKVPRLWPALFPRMPAGKTKPSWTQGILGEFMFWAFAIAIAIYAITLNTHLMLWIIAISVVGKTIAVILRKQLFARPDAAV